MTIIAEEFARDGFVVLEDLFTEAEIDRVSAQVSDVLEGRSPEIPAKEFIYEPGSDPPRVRNVFRLHLYNEFFAQLASDPKITGVVGEILDRPLRLYGSQVFAKPARVGTVVPKHQDMPYWPFSPYALVSAWIALDDSTVENGCVRYVAGSHRLGILPHAPSGVQGNSLGMVENPRIEELEERAVEARRGSVVLHHCLTVHRSEPNRSGQPRRGLIYVYMAPEVQLTDASRLNGPGEFPVVG